jgi:hypothetical protein
MDAMCHSELDKAPALHARGSSFMSLPLCLSSVPSSRCRRNNLHLFPEYKMQICFRYELLNRCHSFDTLGAINHSHTT